MVRAKKLKIKRIDYSIGAQGELIKTPVSEFPTDRAKSPDVARPDYPWLKQGALPPRQRYECMMPGCDFATRNILEVVDHQSRTRYNPEGKHELEGAWIGAGDFTL